MFNQTMQPSAVKVEDVPDNTEHVDENVEESLPEGTFDDTVEKDEVIVTDTVGDTEPEVEVSENTTVNTTTSTLSDSIPAPLSHDDLLSGIHISVQPVFPDSCIRSNRSPLFCPQAVS